MTVLAKASLKSQVQSVINALVVSTETTQNLVIFLKAAQLSGADASSIITQLTTRIEQASSSASVEEIALLTAAASLISNDRENTVASFSTLPAIANPGSIYYAKLEDRLYVRKFSGSWVPLFVTGFNNNLVYGWGSNAAELGDTTFFARSSPVTPVGGITDWTQVEAGTQHTVAIRADGTAWAWGTNNYGKLGDGTVTTRNSPVSVVGGFTDWVQIDAGSQHTVAIRANGTAWGWGRNPRGQLGDNTTSSRSSPVSVVGGFTNWVQISGGTSHTAAVRANGTAWAWGYNAQGQIGDGTTSSRLSPVSVVGGFTDWTQISAGFLHTVAVRSNGTAWGWGYNAQGQIGDGTTSSRLSPVSVVGGFTDWTQISAGVTHVVALRSNGTLWAWGRNHYGQLGDTTQVAKSSPVSVVGGFTDWVESDASYGSHTVGIRSNGTAWTWGRNNAGQLGDGTTTSRLSPVSVTGGFTDWVQIAVGYQHTVAIRAFT